MVKKGVTLSFVWNLRKDSLLYSERQDDFLVSPPKMAAFLFCFFGVGKIQRVPVEPNPPLPRAVSSSELTSEKTAFTTGAITSWAIRSPFDTTLTEFP